VSMFTHYVKVLVPPAVAAPRGARWAANAAASATPLLRRARGFLHRLRARDRLHAAQDLLGFAHSVEREMPNLAAELRVIALRRPDAAD
jgi:hypothetical protein